MSIKLSIKSWFRLSGRWSCFQLGTSQSATEFALSVDGYRHAPHMGFKRNCSRVTRPGVLLKKQCRYHSYKSTGKIRLNSFQIGTVFSSSVESRNNL